MLCTKFTYRGDMAVPDGRRRGSGQRLQGKVAGPQRRGLPAAAALADEAGNPFGTYVLASGVVDYYEVLGVDDDAPVSEIKKAYRSLARECHPDYLGDRGHNICVLLNEAYETLSDPMLRQRYDVELEQALKDAEDNYSGEPLSKWMPTLNAQMSKNQDPAEDRAVFVDEITCIGCKQCVWQAPATFRIEAEHGRSRVFAQWLDKEDDLQAAIDSCPVSCIHWVKKADLPALEYVMQNKCGRVNVGVMMAGQGMAQDVFAATDSFLKERKRLEEEKLRQKRYTPAQEEARRKAAQELLKQNLGFFAHFGDLLGMAYSAMESHTGVGADKEGKVGSRKRKNGWNRRTPTPAYSHYLVPPERALVPIGVYASSLMDGASATANVNAQ